LTNLRKNITSISICFITLFSFLTLPGATFAQNALIDSLEYEIRNSSLPDHFMLDQYYYLARAYQEADIEKSIELANEYRKIATENDSLNQALYALDILIINYEAINEFDSSAKYAEEAVYIAKLSEKPWDVAYFQSQLGSIQIKLGNYYDALENYLKAIEYSKEHKELIKYETAFLNNIGGIYHYLGDDLKALDYFLQSYYIKKENGLTDKLAPSLINIASVYSKLEKFDEALNFHNEAYDLANIIEDEYYMMKALTGLGYDYYLMQKYDLSAENYLQALDLSDSINDKTSKSNILAKLSNVYEETAEKGKAILCANEALNLSIEIKYQYGISSFSRTLGDLYLSKNQYSGALPLYQQSIDVSTEIGAMDNLKDGYFSLSRLYEDLNNSDSALKYYKLFSSLSDSILRHEEADKFTVVQIKHEMEKKGRELENLILENEIKELKLSRSNYLLFGFIAFFILVLVFVIFLIRQHRIRNLQKTSILEQKLLRSQMNPHFIFNTLTAIQKYIFDKSSLLASDYLGRFSNLMRSILNNSSVERIKLEDEIIFLDNYLKLQSLRFEAAFKYEMEIDPEISANEMMISPMLIQPFVENAIEHGLKPRGKDGLLKITMVLKNNYIDVRVEDNGIGREKAKKIKERNHSGHRSMAMEITKERLVHLNKESNRTINFTIADLKDTNNESSGTRVTLNIPFSYI